MKKNEEKIVSYLSGMMTDDERLIFEGELSKSEELKKDFDDMKISLNELSASNQIELNETYFINLLPRVRERLEVKKKHWLIRNFYYLVPTVAATIVLFMFIFNSKTNFEMNYKEVANEVVNNISDKEVSEKYLAELEVDPSNSLSEENSADLTVQIPSEVEVNKEAISKLIDNSDHDTYSTLNNLSDTQLEKIYNELKSKNSK
jgi:hypothetical protein